MLYTIIASVLIFIMYTYFKRPDNSGSFVGMYLDLILVGDLLVVINIGIIIGIFTHGW